jgi:hypothetical protein
VGGNPAGSIQHVGMDLHGRGTQRGRRRKTRNDGHGCRGAGRSASWKYAPPCEAMVYGVRCLPAACFASRRPTRALIAAATRAGSAVMSAVNAALRACAVVGLRKRSQ